GVFVVGEALGLEAEGGAQEGNAAAGEDAFLVGGAGGVHGVLDAGLFLLHLALGGGADVDLGHPARQLGDPLGQLFLIVIAGGFFQLLLDEGNAALDIGLLAGAFDDDGVVLIDLDLLGAAEVLDLNVFELDAEVLEDRLAAGEDGDVFEHGLAAVAVARSLEGGALEGPTQLVYDQRGQG